MYPRGLLVRQKDFRKEEAPGIAPSKIQLRPTGLRMEYSRPLQEEDTP
jgi:hypothetical protein